MNVYLLREGPGATRFTRGYDTFGGFVVVAHDEAHARSLVDRCGDECGRGNCEAYRRRMDYGPPDEWEGEVKPCVWQDPGETDCELVATGAVCEAGVVLESFHAG